MLTRASQKRLQRHVALAQAARDVERSSLPFLYPILYRPLPSKRTSSSKFLPDTRPCLIQQGRYALKSHQHGGSNGRHVASAAAMEHEPEQDPIPFDRPESFAVPGNMLHKEAFPMNGFDSGSRPLIVDGINQDQSKHRSYKGVSGDVNEIHPTLQACLKVGRLSQAAFLIRRLNNIYKPNTPSLLAAHKDYMKEMTLQIMRTQDMNMLQDLLKWFERDVRRLSIPADAPTYALLMQAIAQDRDLDRKSQTLRRYYDYARQAGLEQQTKALVPEMQLFMEELSQESTVPTKDRTTTSSLQTADGDQSSDLPKILQVDIKGHGLSALRESLDPLQEDPASTLEQIQPVTEAGLPVPELGSPEERQRVLERRSVDIAIDRWRMEDAHLKQMGMSSALRRKSSLGALTWTWHEALVPLIREEMDLAKRTEAGGKQTGANYERLHWGPYLEQLDAEKISAVTILACLNVLATADQQHGIKIAKALRAVGTALNEELIAQSDRQLRRAKLGRKLQRMAKTQDRALMSDDARWPLHTRLKAGAMALSNLINVAKIEATSVNQADGTEIRQTLPAFFHTYIYQSGKSIGVIRLSPPMLEKLTQEPPGCIIAKHLPMLSPPKPWTNFHEGGFLEHEISVVRTNEQDPCSKKYAMTAARNGDMSQVFAGLNVLAGTPWRINTRLLKVMIDAWNTGDEIANLPPAHPQIKAPVKPSTTAQPSEFRMWQKKMREHENFKAGLKSNRCFMNFQMEIASAFKDETFYLPHNIDFRGRAYPMSPLFNHMGADNARGLFLFAKGRQLGPRGLWWLKVHLASVSGFDKANYADRYNFTEKHMDDVLDSVSNPLGGRRWWLKAEDPWQCLAACIELCSALELADPTQYISHLPIHQDGTCNGLQHYAALGGDIIGAKQVNLEPGDRPADVYSAVANSVEEYIRKDVAAGDKLAAMLAGRVSRRVVKQTVMTNVYGVTFYGAKQQVRKQLDDVLENLPDDPNLNKGKASEYIARKIFKTLSNMFNGAHEIQYWLGECASRICDSVSPAQITALEYQAEGKPAPSIFRPVQRGGRKDTGASKTLSFITPVIWTTPLKLPVVQPYRKWSEESVKTQLQDLCLEKTSEIGTVHKPRQLQAFPPNFIHSLDGTHMFLTASRCQALGLSFASVHDSFWTHAADVDSMNTVIRDAFIRMHSEDVVGRLAGEFETRYKGHMYLAAAKYESPVASRIREWRAENKSVCVKPTKTRKAAPKQDELLLEVRRLRLLSSKDPSQREKGEAMVTPGSILASASAEDYAVSRSGAESASISAKIKAVEDEEDDKMALVEEEGEDEEHIEGSKAKSRGKKAKGKGKGKVYVWMPLSFPGVPKKGDFDVNRLRDSVYFFS